MDYCFKQFCIERSIPFREEGDYLRIYDEDLAPFLMDAVKLFPKFCESSGYGPPPEQAFTFRAGDVHNTCA